MVTANTTTWLSFKRWFNSLEHLPELIAIQEHKLINQIDIDEASAFLLKAGFASVWGPACKGPKGFPVGGVAIVASLRLGCKPCNMDAPAARAVAAKIQIASDTEFIFVSAYLHSGKGLKQQNLELLGAVAALQQQYQRNLLAAGDWQNPPAKICKTGLLFRGRLSLVAPTRPTCIMKKSSSVIDFFLVSKAMAGRLSKPKALLQNHLATHRPVLAQLAYAKEHYEQKLTMNTKMPPSPLSPTGPYNRPADWSYAAAVLDKAILAASQACSAKTQHRKHAVKEAQRLHDKAYRMLINTAETELASKLDFHIDAPGQRAKEARLERVRSKPIQPKHRISMRFGVLPYRWLQEKGHILFQHLLQSISNNPRPIDDATIDAVYLNL